MHGICMIDEADVIFPPRSDVSKYQSVMAKTHHKVLTHFFEVIDGLLSTPHHQGRLVVLATNLPDSMDQAFRSRIHVEVTFAPERKSKPISAEPEMCAVALAWPCSLGGRPCRVSHTGRGSGVSVRLASSKRIAWRRCSRPRPNAAERLRASGRGAACAARNNKGASWPWRGAVLWAPSLGWRRASHWEPRRLAGGVF